MRDKLLYADVQTLKCQRDALLVDIKKLHDVMEKQKTALDNEQKGIITHFQSQCTQMRSAARERSKKLLDGHVLFDSADGNSANITSLETQTTPIFVHSLYYSIILKVAMMLRDQAVSGGILQFENEQDGRDFIRDIERQIRAMSEEASLKIRTDVDKECESSCTRLNKHLQENTQEILINAQDRLAKAVDIKFQKPHSLKKIDLTSTGYELKLQKTYRPWWLLWLISISYKDGYVEGTTYRIRTFDLKRHCIGQLEVYMSAIENQLNTYLTDVLKNSFDQHFDKLEKNLALYQDYVNKSLDDQARNIDEKATLKVSLVEFIEQINNQINVVADIQKKFESYGYSTSVDVD